MHTPIKSQSPFPQWRMHLGTNTTVYWSTFRTIDERNNGMMWEWWVVLFPLSPNRLPVAHPPITLTGIWTMQCPPPPTLPPHPHPYPPHPHLHSTSLSPWEWQWCEFSDVDIILAIYYFVVCNWIETELEVCDSLQLKYINSTRQVPECELVLIGHSHCCVCVCVFSFT